MMCCNFDVGIDIDWSSGTFGHAFWAAVTRFDMTAQVGGKLRHENIRW
jgi:hypothetical protein